MEQTELERVAEAILFAAGEPVELERIAMSAECDPDEAEQAVRSLMDRLSYERRGIRILRLEHAYQMCSSGRCPLCDPSTGNTQAAPAFVRTAGDPDGHCSLSARNAGLHRADPRRRQCLFRRRAAQ